MALSSLARMTLANDSGATPGAATYDHGFRTYRNMQDDPLAIRYKQFADEARQRGITDPNAIDQYAVTRNREWGQAHGISDRDIKRGKIGVAAIGLGGYGASALGGAAAAEGAAAESGGLAGVQAGDEAFAGVGGAGGGGAGGTLGT